MHSFYISYLLRIWEQDNHDPQQFLASLEKPGSRELVNFKNLDDLFDFLRSQIQPIRISNNYQEGTEE